MDFENINEEMIASIKELYMGFFYKALKMFQVILAGYNASKHKTLQVFKEYGWELYPEGHNGYDMFFMFVYRSKKVAFKIHMLKRLKDGALFVDSFINQGVVEVYISEEDENFELIKRFEESSNGLKSWMVYGNDKLQYSLHRTINSYKLVVTCPIK